jgi:membrane fusion protein (multidrug efflux system)
MNPAQPNTPAIEPKSAGPGAPKAPPMRLKRFALIAAVIILIGLVIGLLPRWLARRALVRETQGLAVTSVAVVSPTPGKTDLGVPLTAEVQAFVEAPIYARASGYLKRWLVDIGDRVKAGQLLAEIDTPELNQQLEQARAEVAQAEAALNLAKTTAARWTDLLKTASVSEQETSEKQADLELKKANVDGARANLHRLEELKGFAKVTAPFDGTITARQTDVGQLIAAANGRELFRLAQISPLRLYVRVPQTMSYAIAPGQKAELILDQMPGHTFEAKVVRTAGAMDPGSRTLLTELEVDNSRGEILAGSYAQVRFTDTVVAPTLTLPANTLLFRSDGIRVGVVNGDGKVELRSIKLGRDFGQTIEILEGVAANDRVIMNPPDSLASGLKVRVVEPVKSIVEK